MAVGDTLHADTFQRADASGTGKASDGHSYTTGGNGSWSISSKTLKVTSVDTLAWAEHGGAASGNVNLLVDLKVDSFVSSMMNSGAFLRGTFVNGYRVGIHPGNELRLFKVVNGTDTLLVAASVPLAGGVWYRLRVVMVGTRIAARAWPRIETEPTTWDIDRKDSTYSSGACGFYLRTYTPERVAFFDAFTLKVADATSFTSLASRKRTITSVTASLSERMPRVVDADAALSGSKHRFVPVGACVSKTYTRTITSVTASVAPPETGIHVRSLPDRVEYELAYESISIRDRDGQRSTCEFTLYDRAGAYALTEGQHFEVTGDGAREFVGFIDSIETERLPGESGMKVLVVRGKDERARADARTYTGPEWRNETAGSILVDLHANLLADEGIDALYARDLDENAATFEEGTLSHVEANENGALILSREGNLLDVIVSDDAGWDGGTYDGTQVASDGTLTLDSQYAIRLSGFANAAKGKDLSLYRKIWGGTQSVASGDRLCYDIWCAGGDPEAKSGVDLIFSDKSYLRKSALKDQYGVAVSPKTDLSSRAVSQWYHREISLTSYAGKSIKSVLIGMEGDISGHYTTYFKNIQLTTSAGAQKIAFFVNDTEGEPAVLQTNSQVSSAGYSQVSCRAVKTYPQSGTWTSPNYSLDSMDYAMSSPIQWSADIPEETSFTLASSISGSPPMECQQNQELPNLPSGSYTIGKHVNLIVTLSQDENIAHPLSTPRLSAYHLRVEPAYYQNKYDVEYIGIGGSGLGANGTNVGVVGTSDGLQLLGFRRDFDDGDLTNQTVYASGGSPQADIDDGTLLLSCGAGNEVRLRQDAADEWHNFTAELDVYIAGSSTANQGLVFRTGGADWTNSKGHFAYWMWMDDSSMRLDKGSGSGAITNIANVACDVPTDSWHRLKVICNETSIQGYMDDELYIDVSDSTHNHTGYLAPGFWNDTGTTQTGQFDNFGVCPLTLSGTHTHDAISLSSVGTVYVSQISWDADVPDVCTLLIEASTNGGASFSECANGGVIPGLERGTSASGRSLIFRVTLKTANANATPTLKSIWVRVNGLSLSGGTRVSPPLSLTSALHLIGSSSVSWDADIPTGTALLVETSLDAGASWQAVTNGASIPGITDAPPPWSDGFDSDTSSDYTFVTL